MRRVTNAFAGAEVTPQPPKWGPGVAPPPPPSGAPQPSDYTTKPRPDPQRVRMSGGERPIGAAKGKQSDTEALCQPPPPQSPATQPIFRPPLQKGDGHCGS